MIDFDIADTLVVRMDRELCKFLNESEVFAFNEENARCSFAAQMNLFTQKAGFIASLLYLTGNNDASEVRKLLTDLTVSAFDRAMIKAGDKVCWKPEGHA